MATKYTMLFEVTTGTDDGDSIRRTGGWTESVYWSGDFTPTTRRAFEQLCQRRAAFLTRSAKIVGQRYQQVNPKGKTVSGGAVYPGNTNYETDYPNKALLLKIPSRDTGNVSKKKVACIPDEYVRNGEYKPDAAFKAKVTIYMEALSAWQFYGVNLAPTTYPIFNIATDGVCNTTVVHTLTAGQMVYVSRAQTSSGVFVNGTYMVGAPVGAQTFKLLDWEASPTLGGTVALKAPKSYYIFDGENGHVNRVTTRKIGRPFTGFVGRVSKRA